VWEYDEGKLPQATRDLEERCDEPFLAGFAWDSARGAETVQYNFYKKPSI
jgi:hypothetical protein